VAIKLMKFAPISRFRSGLLLATLALLLNTVSVSFADQFGTTVAPDWQTWAVFSQGGGVTDNTVVDDQSGTTSVQGNVGVWGTGNINLSGNATINGDLYYRSTGKLSISGNATITGTKHHDAAGDAVLQNSSNEAYMESDQLWAMPPTPGYPTTINTGSNMTITGTGHVVLSLQDFVLTGGVFTIVGTSPATTFVFNVSRNFSLSGTSQIVLSGITPSNVVFNVRGTGTDATIGGSSAFQGILLANYRNVKVSGSSSVNGEIVGNKVTLAGGAHLTHASP
jgi:cytoskeletal protein CcmA (bactofilin family)